MSIGQVVDQVRAEFPTLTVSKLRFLEDQGIVTPVRTGAGYRKYCAADVERVRFALSCQRDSYMPLRVIRENLAELDAGHEIEVKPTARVVTTDGELLAPTGESLGRRQLMDLTAVSAAELDAILAAGLVAADRRGRFPTRSLKIVSLILSLHKHGIEPRHLRSVRAAVDRSADTITTVLAPLRAQGAGVEQENAAAQAMDLAEIYAQLHTELLRAACEKPT